jgi:hypothetical protein
MASNLLNHMTTVNRQAAHMSKRVATFFLMATTVLMYSFFACAAIFEMPQPLPAGGKPQFRLLPDGTIERPYQTMLVDHTGERRFPSSKTRIATAEDVLWVAIGDAGLLGITTPFPEEDVSLNSFEARTPFARNTQAGSVDVPEQRTAPETWVVILVGAGLIWFHMRRKARHHAIRFTAF